MPCRGKCKHGLQKQEDHARRFVSSSEFRSHDKSSSGGGRASSSLERWAKQRAWWVRKGRGEEEEVIAYIERVSGEEQVCQTICDGTMSARVYQCWQNRFPPPHPLPRTPHCAPSSLFCIASCDAVRRHRAPTEAQQIPEVVNMKRYFI